MAESYSPNQFVRFFNRLTSSQKIMLGSVTAAVIIVIVLLVNVLNRPSFAMLYSNLNPEDASKIVVKLKERNVPYQLEDGGKSVLVPKLQVYDLRLAFAGEGLPQSSVIGYEIFDRTNLGVSDFVQRINYRRALEGEIARTILKLDEVEGARVHIVVPDKALFKEDEKSATASVVLKLKSSKPLKREIIQGIAHLVSSSVEGLESNDVTIVDSKGLMLSENSKQNSLTSLSSTQYEMQQKIETYLSNKAQSLVEGAIGTGNVKVQVNAELDFRQVDRTLEQYDPEKTAIRSEQVSEEKSAMSDSLPPSSRSSAVTNYEVNKSIEHIVESVGAVKRLSVAAMVNGNKKTTEKEGQKTSEYIPRTSEEMNQLTDIIKRAVGFSLQRGDEVSVVNMQFGTSVEEGEFLYKETPWTNWYDLGEKLFLLSAMIAAVFVIRSLLNRIRVRVTSGEGDDEELYSTQHTAETAAKLSRRRAMALPAMEAEISEEAQLREGKRKRIADYMKDKPEDAVRLLKVWLSED
jgi:flagellar M-ring protein FliF